LRKNVAQNVAEYVLSTAKDGGVKAFVVPIATFQRRNPRQTSACRRPTASLGHDVKDEHVKHVAKDVAKGAVKDMTQDLAFGGLGSARHPRHATTATAAVFAQQL